MFIFLVLSLLWVTECVGAGSGEPNPSLRLSLPLFIVYAIHFSSMIFWFLVELFSAYNMNIGSL